MEADQMLMLRLSVEGFDGPAWQELITHVYDYSRRTLHGFIIAGLLPIKVRQVLPGNRHAVGIAQRFVDATEGEFRHVRDDVVAESLAVTLSYWRRRVIPRGTWDPREGAQLRTYFVNVALKRLVKIAQRTLRQLDQLPDSGRTVERHLAVAAADPVEMRSPYSRVDDAEAARCQLAALQLTDLEWRIFALAADGHTHEQIAAIVGLPTAKAVEGRIARCRRRLAAA